MERTFEMQQAHGRINIDRNNLTSKLERFPALAVRLARDLK